MNQKEYQVLAEMFARLKPGKSGKKNSQSVASTPGTSGQAVTVGSGKRRRKRARKSGIESSTKVSRKELVVTVTRDAAGKYAKALSLNPSSSVMPWLAGLVKSFEQIVWHKVQFTWVPMVGTTVAGSIAMGMDWASKLSDTDATRAKVVALSPVLDTPLWQRANLNLPNSRLQSRRFYTTDTSDPYDSCPGTLLVNVTTDSERASKTDGEIWVEYSVSLFGTKSNA